MICSKTANCRKNTNSKVSLYGLFAVFILTVLAFISAIEFDFISYDDPIYITENTNVNSGLSLTNAKWAMISTGKTNLWHPITFLSHQLDVELFGLSPRWHHAVSIFWHALAAGLLFLVAQGLSKSSLLAFFIALLWAIHPEKIQSVAWLSERKDVLSGAFFFASIYSFMKWRMNQHRFLYLLSFCLFVLALMSKPSVVTLPLVLFVLFYAKKNIVRSAFSSLPVLLPFYLASCAAAGVAIYFQSIGDLASVSDQLSVVQRVSKIPVSFTFYLERFLWPHPSQLWFYPPTSIRDSAISLAIIAVLVPLFTWLCLKERLIALGVATYVLMWLPVSGVVTVGYYFTADRYSYLPMLGLVLILVGFVKWVSNFAHGKKMLATVVLSFILIQFFVGQQLQLPIWKNDETLFSNEMKVNPRSLLAPIHYGAIYDKSDPEKALRYYEKAHEIDRESGLALMNMGISQKKLGKTQDALESFAKGMRVKMPEVGVWTRCFILQAELQMYAEAEITIRDGLNKFPKNMTLVINAASYFINKESPSEGDLKMSMQLFSRAQKINPADPDANLGCGTTQLMLGNIEKAKYYYRLLPREMRENPSISEVLNR